MPCPYWITLPLLMIILGGSLYIDFQKKGRIYYLEILKFVVIKNFLFPLMFTLFSRFFAMP